MASPNARVALTPGFFDQVAVNRHGLDRVVNAAVANPELETERQKDLIYGLLPPGEWRRCSILDMCCGIGRLTRWFGQVAKSAVGVDWSPEMLRIANQTPAMASVEYRMGDVAAKCPDFIKGKMDVVFQWCAFLHILDDGDWLQAVMNMQALARRWIIYGDKVNDNTDVNYVKVRPVAQIRAAMTMTDKWELIKSVPYRCEPEDDFAILLFRKKRHA